jgi:hypothetical protein
MRGRICWNLFSANVSTRFIPKEDGSFLFSSLATGVGETGTGNDEVGLYLFFKIS